MTDAARKKVLRIASYYGDINLIGPGEARPAKECMPAVPWLEPKQKYEDCMVYDRAICKAGVKLFIRRIMASEALCFSRCIKGTAEEWSALAESIQDLIDRGACYLVSEVRPGHREKRPIICFLNSEN